MSIYTRLLLNKISFHVKVRPSAASTPHCARVGGFAGACVTSAKTATTVLFYFSFHKHPEFPPGLEVSDEVLEKTAGTDVNNM